MLHAFGQVSYFNDGLNDPSKRGETVPLFTTGAPLSDAQAERIVEFFPRIPGFGDLISTAWRLHSVFITQTRVWSCSSAKFTMVIPFLGMDKVLLPPIHPEMPICIDLGYVKQLYAGPQAISADNEGKPYAVRRRFMGYIDSIQIKVTSKRIICTVSARDKLRFLIDNRMVGFFNAYDLMQGEVKSRADLPNNTLGANLSLAGKGEIARQQIIRDIMLSGSNGAITVADLSTDGTNFENIDGFKAGVVDEEAVRNKLVRENLKAVEDPSSVGALSNSFIVMNKAPIEPLKRLSTLEANLPKELYADHNGKVFWKRRIAKNFEDPVKYYLFKKPVGAEDASPIISAASEFSTVGTINQMVVVNPLYGVNNNSSSVLAMAGTLDTAKVFGFPMIPRTRFIFDETLSGRNVDANTVTPVLEAEFMIWGKDIRGADVEVAGNPSLYVGDSVHVDNLPFFYYDDAASKTLRADSVIDQLIAEGPKKGYRTRMLLTLPVETYKDTIRENLKSANISAIQGLHDVVKTAGVGNDLANE